MSQPAEELPHPGDDGHGSHGLGTFVPEFIMAGIRRLLRFDEDEADVAAADAAWAEGGELIPLEEVKAEFGLR